MKIHVQSNKKKNLMLEFEYDCCGKKWYLLQETGVKSHWVNRIKPVNVAKNSNRNYNHI